MDDWIKDLAPSPELRKWFNHDPSKFQEFKKKYAEELDDTKKIWFPLIKKYLPKKITLLYAAHDPEINHAICLKNYLEKHLL